MIVVPSVRPADGAGLLTNGSGARVLLPFWIVAGAIAAAWLAGADFSSPPMTAAALAVMLIGGIPHGAFDIALLARTGRVETRRLALAVAGYVAVAVAMAGLWAVLPTVALVVFLAAAALHFGEDWAVLDDPLLRTAAGASVIAAPAIGQFAAVAALFDSLAGGATGTLVARIAVAAAPVVLLVALVALVIAAQQGSRGWAAAMAVALAVLVATPPVVGFALFFVFLHSPRHLVAARRLLRDVPQWRWTVTGAALTALAIGGGLAVLVLMGLGAAEIDPAQAFRLLAIVAMPHLLLSHWLARFEPILAGVKTSS